ncbi:MAG: phospholipid-binding protein [Rhodospirillaceae bacterium]|nr:phospholipid-binding protein [Rhodospirillaceae bacterium]
MNYINKLFSYSVIILSFVILQSRAPATADDFAFSFEWGDIPRCTTGSPTDVDNPIFTLSNLPAGTVEIDFKLRDLDAPSWFHGGGTIQYVGEDVIQPGAFRYKSPCPPSGKHRYRWKATAKNADGDVLAEAKSIKHYP